MFTAKPGVPILIEPANEATEITLFPELEWKESIAEKYYVYLGTSSELDYRNLVAERNEKFYQTAQLLPDTQYYWRIEASNDGGAVTSLTYTFRTTGDMTQYYPEIPKNQNAVISEHEAGYKVEFTWLSDRTDSFNLYFGEEPNPALFISGLSQNRAIIEQLLPNQRYYWKIESVNGFSSTTGEVWSFDTPSTHLSKPIALFPENGSQENELSINLNWSPVSCPFGGTVSYAVYFNGTGSFSEESVVDVNLSDRTLLIQDLTVNTTYYWKIKAHSVYGESESDVFSFVTRDVGSDELPVVPYMPFPVNLGGSCDVDTDFSWSSARVDSYSFFLGTDINELYEVSSNLTVPAFQNSRLEYGTTYYWRIEAKNGYGSVLSPIWSFSTESEDQLPPEVSSITISFPYIQDGKLEIGKKTNLKTEITAEDDKQLASIEMKVYAKKRNDAVYTMIEDRARMNTLASDSMKWNVYSTVSGEENRFFGTLGLYDLFAEAIAIDSRGEESEKMATEPITIEIFDPNPIPDIVGDWEGSFSIAYVVFMSDEILIKISLMNGNEYEIKIEYKGKTYTGTGTIDVNGDLLIQGTVEGVKVLLTGVLQGNSYVSGSIHAFSEAGELIKDPIGTWQATKTE